MGFNYEYDESKSRLRINLQGQVLTTTLEDSEEAMADAIERLIEVKKVETLSLVGDREYEYDASQTEMLSEIAYILEELSTNIISKTNILNGVCTTCMPARFAEIQDIVVHTLRKDPIGAYVKARRIFRTLKKHVETEDPHKECHIFYLQNVLYKILEDLGNTKLIQAASPHIAGYKYGDRSVYRKILHPTIKPNFMSTRFVTIPPSKSEPLVRYDVQGVGVEIFKVPGKVRNVYHIVPPEFNLSEEHYQILETARRYMSEHKPKDEEFTKLDKIRDIFFNISRDMVKNVAKSMNVSLDSNDVNNLGRILTRYTAGLGVLEILLADEKIQDVYINSPIGSQPIYIYHADYEDCETNIIPTQEDAEVWATRFRISSGRPLDEANPVLDTEVNVPGGRARVSVITRSVSPSGLAYALRRHRDDPWTYPLLMKAKMMNSLSAGLMWFLVDGSRTMLFAGTRSAGKTSVLGATMAEIMKRYRILTVEDTLELPIEKLRQIGYNIQSMKSRSVITHVETELSSEEALRTALRLGDSALIIGEVRSVEAKALYEAMRIGALANVVAGTIHGDSPYGVFDRVVNDLDVKPTSFKATDIIVVANRLKSADGLKSFRRLTSLTEVRKHWKDDPQEEGGFVPLMEYSAKKDTLVPTQTLLAGESHILNDIASNVREWSGNWEAVWDNIQLRARIKETLMDVAVKLNMPELLEARFTTVANDQFYFMSDVVKNEVGAFDTNMIYEKWYEWIKETVKKR